MNYSGQYMKVAAKYYLKEREELFLECENAASMNAAESMNMFYTKFEHIHAFMEGNSKACGLILNHELMKNGYLPLILDRLAKAICYDFFWVVQTNYNVLVKFIEKNIIASIICVINMYPKNLNITIGQELKT